MHTLAFELNTLMKHDRSGSFTTRSNRRSLVHLLAGQLVELGYRQLHARDLKGRHVNALLRLWKTQGLADATIANRLATLRWLTEQLGRPGIMARSNAAYGLAPRHQVAKVSKAKTLDETKLGRITDPYVRMSLELQREFGLRREEALKIRPLEADQGTHLTLQGSWCKGGRPRQIPLLTASQRETLDRAKALAYTNQRGSLIPQHLQYVQQLNRYTGWCRRVGLSQNHGLRHRFAQRRFAELAGFPCPVAGGPHQAALTPEQQRLDDEARAIVSEELGHWRPQITATYIGT